MAHNAGRSGFGLAALAGLALPWLAAAPASAAIVETDTVKFDTAEVKFGLSIDPVVPGILYWDYDGVSANENTPTLVGVLENRGLASGECVRLKVEYYDGSTHLTGHDDVTATSCGPGDDPESVNESFSHPTVDKVKVIAQVDSGGGWIDVGSKTRRLWHN